MYLYSSSTKICKSDDVQQHIARAFVFQTRRWSRVNGIPKDSMIINEKKKEKLINWHKTQY